MTQSMKKRENVDRPKARRDEAPEDALWRHVILQALTDAMSPIRVANQGVRLDRLRAREWFERQCRDFRLVCELAGLEAQRVHQFAMMKIRESIEQENARTAEHLTSAMSGGVVSNFLQVAPDRHTSDARESPEIEFSQNEVSPS